MRFKEKTYYLLLLTALLLLVMGIFNNQTADMHVKDTYIVYPARYAIWAIALFFMLLWLLYLATDKLLFSKILSRIHILLTIGVCVFLIVTPYLRNNVYDGMAGVPRRYLDSGPADLFSFYNIVFKIDFILMVVVTVGQLIYIVNLSMGLYKKKPGNVTVVR